MKLSLNRESANALREFSESMPFAVDNIVEETGKLINVYQSVADSLGVHQQAFYDLLMHIKKAQENAAEAIQALPPMLIHTAEKIEAYVDAHPTVE